MILCQLQPRNNAQIVRNSADMGIIPKMNQRRCLQGLEIVRKDLTSVIGLEKSLFEAGSLCGDASALPPSQLQHLMCRGMQSSSEKHLAVKRDAEGRLSVQDVECARVYHLNTVMEIRTQVRS